MCGIILQEQTYSYSYFCLDRPTHNNERVVMITIANIRSTYYYSSIWQTTEQSQAHSTCALLYIRSENGLLRSFKRVEIAVKKVRNVFKWCMFTFQLFFIVFIVVHRILEGRGFITASGARLMYSCLLCSIIISYSVFFSFYSRTFDNYFQVWCSGYPAMLKTRASCTES